MIDRIFIFLLIFICIFFLICWICNQIAGFTLSKTTKIHNEVCPLLEAGKELCDKLSKVKQEDIYKFNEEQAIEYIKDMQLFFYLSDRIEKLQLEEDKWLKRTDWFLNNNPGNPLFYWWVDTFGGPEL